jgi:hypothetical protein
MFGIASNASLADGDLVMHVIPHWFRVFGESLEEVVVVLDDKPPVGRIANQNRGLFNKERAIESLDRLRRLDPRFRWVSLSSLDIGGIQKKWFGRHRPYRCQDGSPILPFVATVEVMKADIVLRCDSDMLYFDNGWSRRIVSALQAEEFDLYEVPRLVEGTYAGISSRAFFLRRSQLDKKLPLRSVYIDPLRVVYRTLQKRSRYKSLEQMLERAIERRQFTFHRDLGPAPDGYSVHGARRQYAVEPWYPEAVQGIEAGRLPELQRNSWDLSPAAWSSVLAASPH